MNASRLAAVRRAPFLLLAITLAWLLAAFLVRDGRAVGLFHDDGIYVAAAQSLAAGHGYRIPNLPGAPWQTKYPVLFPALLALVWKLFPTFPANAGAFQALVTLLGAGLIPLSFLVARRLFGLAENPAIAVAGLLAASPWLLGLTRWVLTELPYATAAIAALLLCERTFAAGSRRAAGPALLAGLAVAVGCLLKSQGIALAAAVLALLLAERRWREAAGFLAGWFPLPALGLGWQLAHTDPGASPLLDYYLSYRSSMLDLATGGGLAQAATGAVVAVTVFAHNLWRGLLHFATFLALPEALPSGLRATLIAALLLAGLALAWQRGARLTALYFLLFLASTLVMPWEPLRYLVPLLPLVLALAALVFEAAAARVAGGKAPGSEIVRRRLRLARSIMLGVALVAFGIGLGREALTYRPEAVPEYVQWSAPWRDWQGFAETIDWLRAHTGPEDVVASPLDPFYYLHTGRRGVRYWFHNPQTYFYPGHAAPQLGSVAEIAPELRRLGVRWLVREPALQDFYAESGAADELALQLVASPLTGGQLVFRSRDSGHFIYRFDWPASSGTLSSQPAAASPARQPATP